MMALPLKAMAPMSARARPVAALPEEDGEGTAESEEGTEEELGRIVGEPASVARTAPAGPLQCGMRAP